MQLYPLVVIAHVFLVIVSFGAHGVSSFAIFQVRRETDRSRLSAVLELSTASLVVAGVGLLAAVLLGIVAAIMGGHFSRAWPWVSIAVVVVVYLAMTPLAANPLGEVRTALGMPVRQDKKNDPPKQPADDATLAAAQAKLRPGWVLTIGLIAIAVLVWLMESKPF